MVGVYSHLVVYVRLCLVALNFVSIQSNSQVVCVGDSDKLSVVLLITFFLLLLWLLF